MLLYKHFLQGCVSLTMSNIHIDWGYILHIGTMNHLTDQYKKVRIQISLQHYRIDTRNSFHMSFFNNYSGFFAISFSRIITVRICKINKLEKEDKFYL